MKKIVLLVLLGLLASCSNISSSSSSSVQNSNSSSSSERLPYPDKIVTSESHNNLDYSFGYQYKDIHNQKLYAKCGFHEIAFNFKDYNVPSYHIAGDYLYLKFKGAYESNNVDNKANYNYMYFIGEIYEVVYEKAKCILIEDNLIKRDDNNCVTHISKYERFEYIVTKTNNEFIPLSEYSGEKIYVTIGARDEKPYALYSFDPTKENPSNKDMEWEFNWD